MNERDINACVQRDYDAVYRFSCRMLGAPDAARDVVQESFLRLAKSGPAEVGESARRWLFTVARNLCIDELRRLARSQPIAKDPGATKTNRPQQNETAAAVAAAVALLEPEFREAIVLREYEGMSYAEIASILECPEGTVKSRIARGRERLRALLKDFTEAQR